jgi:type I restriction enzyme S subunit
LWVKEFKRATPLFALHLLRGMRLEQYNGGVSVPTLDRKVVHKAEVLLPPAPIVARFESVADDVYRQINTLSAMNEKLRTARDLLLPRLMSGELTV